MSRKTRIAIWSVIILSLISVTAFAEGKPFFANMTFDQDSFRVIYSGVSGSQPIKVVNAVVVQGFDGVVEDANICGIDSVFTDEGGVFSGSIDLSPTTPPGEYKILVDSENGHESKRFIVIDEAETASFLSNLNGYDNETDNLAAWETNKSAFKAYFEANHKKFGIVLEDFENSCSSFAEDVIFSQKPAGGYASGRAVSNAFDKAVAVYGVKTAEDMDAALKNYASILGIEYDEYSALASESKTLLNTLLQSYDYAGCRADDFATVYEKSLIYAEVKTANSWAAQRNKILQYAEKLQSVGFVFPQKFDLIKNKDAVYQEFFKERNGISGFDDLKAKFESAVDKIYEEEKKSSSGNSSSSGGGGGGSASGGSGSSGSSGGGFVNTRSSVMPGGVQLSDITAHWAEQYINKLVKKGGISGYEDGTFKPDNTITRAEFVKIIVSVFELSGDSADEYSDVSKGAWYSDYIAKASSNGIIYGSDGMFFPNSNITRQDAAVIIYRVLKLKVIATQEGIAFSDDNEISEYAKEAVDQMSGIGIINGYDGKFMPTKNITRAEASTIIALAMDLM